MKAGRGGDRLNCMVRDPNWIYCYWDLAGDALERAAKGRPPRFLETVRWVLRASPAGGAEGDEGGSGDVEVGAKARDWYLKVRPGRRYRVELGLVTAGGDFVPLVSGGETETPAAALGEGEDAAWHEAGDWGPLTSEVKRLLAQGLVGSSATSLRPSGSSPSGAYVASSKSLAEGQHALSERSESKGCRPLDSADRPRSG